MLADAGFDGQTVQEDDRIPPIRRGGNLVQAERRGRAEWVARRLWMVSLGNVGRPKR